jgi:hypothetical protein
MQSSHFVGGQKPLEQPGKGARVTIAEMGDRHSVANALANMSRVAILLGDRNRSISFAEESLRFFEQMGDPNAAKVRVHLATLKSNQDPVG